MKNCLYYIYTIMKNEVIEGKGSQKSVLTDTFHQSMNKIDEGVISIWSKFKISSQDKDEDHEGTQWHKKKTFGFSNITIIRGSLIGVTISAFLRWNSGRYNRLSFAFRQRRFTRNLIVACPKPAKSWTDLTKYYTPNLETPMHNFICFSGEAGIGKSSHFQNLAYLNSGIRPALYLSFKASGKDGTFQDDLAQQVNYGSDCPGVLSEIIRAVKQINQINKKPHRLWWEILGTHGIFFGITYALFTSSIEATLGLLSFSLIGVSYIYYINFMIPFFIQSLRRTCPLVIFDDLNKMEQMNMLSEIVRYLQLLENGMANVILVSSDEETWSKLRREPGMKDRLRLRHINYNHTQTAERLISILDDEKNYQTFMHSVSGNQLYDRKIVVNLIRELIGKRQVTLRRFISLLKLNDEEQYQKLVETLELFKSGKIKTAQAVQNFTDILFDSEMETMVANMKNIKRQMKISEQSFLLHLRILLKKGRLPSDNELASNLKAYNIVRDLRSEYVINGKFMYTVLSMAILEYQKDHRYFEEDSSSNHGSSSLPSQQFLQKSGISSKENISQHEKKEAEEQKLEHQKETLKKQTI